MSFFDIACSEKNYKIAPALTASGPVTRAQFIDYLWRHEGEPASAGVCTFTDVTEEHEYFDAQAVAAADLASLTGGDDEAVLNCDEVLAEFFGEEAAKDEEIEAAA